jgi:hypothetical protein
VSSSPNETRARVTASPLSLVPLVLARSSTQTPCSSQVKRACCRDRPGSGITTFDGAVRPTISDSPRVIDTTVAPSRW